MIYCASHAESFEIRGNSQENALGLSDFVDVLAVRSISTLWKAG
jgi:hypothetical protein